MANFMHKASGVMTDGSAWSFGLNSTGAITEAAAETAWAAAVAAFFADATVKTYFMAGTVLSLTSTSTASASWKQTTKTSTTHAVAGTSAGLQLPPRTTVLLSLYSAQATRWGRGRITLPSPTSTLLSADGKGQLLAAAGTAIGAAATTMFGSITGAGLTPLLVTKRATKSGRPAFSTVAVTSGLVWHKFDTQRRRADKIVVTSTAFTA
jgi:hypothetical protein